MDRFGLEMLRRGLVTCNHLWWTYSVLQINVCIQAFTIIQNLSYFFSF